MVKSLLVCIAAAVALTFLAMTAQAASTMTINPQFNSRLRGCLPPKVIWEFQCVDPCPSNMHHTSPNGACTTRPCGPFFEIWKGQCARKCPIGQVHLKPDGRCFGPQLNPVGPRQPF